MADIVRDIIAALVRESPEWNEQVDAWTKKRRPGGLTEQDKKGFKVLSKVWAHDIMKATTAPEQAKPEPAWMKDFRDRITSLDQLEQFKKELQEQRPDLYDSPDIQRMFETKRLQILK